MHITYDPFCTINKQTGNSTKFHNFVLKFTIIRIISIIKFTYNKPNPKSRMRKSLDILWIAIIKHDSWSYPQVKFCAVCSQTSNKTQDKTHHVEPYSALWKSEFLLFWLTEDFFCIFFHYVNMVSLVSSGTSISLINIVYTEITNYLIECI